ncbi:MAG: T9SS type A sorting domain-containing protein [Bacteroidia bacterium]|jgi:hypothetical protein|nr:T9SS type A sorting domain-containing protein [Bacteroidia bacterium]
MENNDIFTNGSALHRRSIFSFQMKKQIILLCFLCLAAAGFAQTNLIPNPSLEEKDTLATSPLACVPKHWYSPNSTGSPDYVDSSFTSMNGFVQYPLSWTTANTVFNRWGNYNYTNIMNDGDRAAHHGTSYMGMGVDVGVEYIATELLDTLQAGKTYAFEYHLLLSNWSHLGFDHIGAAFTQDRLVNFNINDPFQFVLSTYDAGGQTGQCLLDTTNWMTVRDTFIAEGGEKFMTIGTPDTSNLTLCRFEPSGGAYYFVDNFKLICLDCDTTNVPPRPVAPVIPADYTGIRLSPNPIITTYTLTYDLPEGGVFTIYDGTGRSVYTDNLQAGDIQRAYYLPDHIATGIYFWSVSNGNTVLQHGKMIVTR